MRILEIQRFIYHSFSLDFCFKKILCFVLVYSKMEGYTIITTSYIKRKFYSKLCRLFYFCDVELKELIRELKKGENKTKTVRPIKNKFNL